MRKNTVIIKGLLLATLMIFADITFAQRLRVPAEVNFETWFDNREYKSDNAIDQTLFGARLTPIVGLMWGEHSINIGGDFRAEFGSKSFSINPEFIMFYNYESSNFNAYAGVFPRRKVLGDYPVLFFSDSVKRYDTNLDGALFQYIWRDGHVELACDWLSMISESQREKFVVFSSGFYMHDMQSKKPLKFFAGYYASMFHHSVSKTEEGVVDNLLVYPYVGVRYSKEPGVENRKKFYSLMLKAGWVQGMQRDRKYENVFVKPGGAQIEAEARWRSLGVYNTLYLGDDLMPYYERYSNGLYQGDPLYRTKGDVFNRTEIFWEPLRRRDISVRASWVEVYDGKKWGCQQLVTLSVNLNSRSFNY